MAIRMGDDEIIVSDYGVDELWKNLPGSAVDEILGYLDLRQLQIFSRYDESVVYRLRYRRIRPV